MNKDDICTEYPERGFLINKESGGRYGAWLIQDSELSEIAVPCEIGGYAITVFTVSKKLPAKLKLLRLPATVEEIRVYDQDVFGRQTLELLIDEDNPFLFSDGKAVYSKDGVTLIRFVAGGCKNYEVRGGVRFIGELAFRNMSRLRSLSFPDSLLSIGPMAFRGCSGIRELAIPSSVTFIGASAFREMTSLQTINLPSGLKRLKQGTFHMCTALETLHIPASVERIEGCVTETLYKDSVFPNSCSGSAALRSITVDEDNPYFTAENGILYSKDGTRLIFAPEKAVGERFAVHGGVEVIESSAFQFNRLVDEIVLTPRVREIGNAAFFGCKRLRVINLENVKVLGKYAFEECTRLESVSLSCEEIPENAFSKCHHLESVTLKNTRFIGRYAFFHCENRLLRAELPEGLERLGDSAFYKCKKLSIGLPGSLKEMGSFSLGVLREVVIPEAFDCNQMKMLWNALNCVGDIAVRNMETGEISYKIATPYGGSSDFHLVDIAQRCFGGSGFDFEMYDREILRKLNSGIFTMGKASAAFLRLEYPKMLSDTAREGYVDYLTKNAVHIVHIAALNNEFAMIERCMRYGVITSENITAAVDETVRYGRTEFTAALLDYKNRSFPEIPSALALD